MVCVTLKSKTKPALCLQVAIKFYLFLGATDLLGTFEVQYWLVVSSEHL